MRFPQSDEFLAVVGRSGRDLASRVAGAIPGGVCLVRTPFVTAAVSGRLTRDALLVTTDDCRTGCLVDGRLLDAPRTRSPAEFWRTACGLEMGSFNLLFWDEPLCQAIVRTDPLGYRALYWWTDSSKRTLAVGSSLRLMREIVPGLRPDRAGFREQLLISATIDGRTLLRGVWRLGPERALHLGPLGVHRVPVARRECWGDSYAALPTAKAAEQVVEIAGTVVADWLRGARATVALSGGYDSRLLLLLARRAGTELEAVTLGDRHWVDQRLAARVAAFHGVPHRVIAPPARTTLGEYLRALETVEHTADYMSGFWLCRYAKQVSKHWQPVLNGFLGGPVSGAAVRWTCGSVRRRGELVRGWLRHVNRSNVPFALLRSLSPRDSRARRGTDNENEMASRLVEYCPSGLPLFQALTFLEMVVRQVGFVSLGTYGLYRRFSEPITPLADQRIVQLFGNMARRHLDAQRAYKRAVSLLDQSRVAFASTSTKRPATFHAGPERVVEAGFADLAPAFCSVIREHSGALVEFIDPTMLVTHIEAVANGRKSGVTVPQSLMLVNAALLWLLYSGVPLPGADRDAGVTE